MEWKLTDEENPYPLIKSGLPTNDFCYSQHDLADAFEEGARAQAKKLVEELSNIGRWAVEIEESLVEEECYKSTISFEASDWQELRREVGLE